MSRGAHAAAALKPLPTTQDVSTDNPPESLFELSDAVGVDEGVYDGIAVGQDDGRVHDQWRWAVAIGTKEREAVDDVQRQPADCKKPDYDGQRLGGLHLLLQCGA